MTDVVEIARSRRSRLAAEIARLDDFIRMAEMLLKYGDEVDRGAGGRFDDANPVTPLLGLGAESGSGGHAVSAGNVPSQAAFGESAGTTPADSGARTAVPDENTATFRHEAEPSGGDPDHFHFGASVQGDEAELVLTDDFAADSVVVDASIGQKVRQRRWMLGLTKKQLADRLGIEVDEVQKFERGDARITTGRLPRLAAALEAPVSYFLETADGRSREARELRPAHSADSSARLPAAEVALAQSG